MHDIAVEGLLGSTSHAPFLKQDNRYVKFCMQVIKELLPPPLSTDSSHIPPEN